MKIGDLVRHTQRNIVGVIVDKKDRNPAWTCNVWVVLFTDGLVNGTDYNLEVISEAG